MDDLQKAQEAQTPRDPSIKSRPLPLRRLTTAVAGAVALVGLSVGVALAATSGDDSRPRHGVTSTVPPDGDSAGTDDGGTVGVNGSDGGTDDGGTTIGGGSTGSGGTDGDGSTVGGGSAGSGGTDGDGTGGTGPSPAPTSSGDLAELNRRITELDKKVDQLPTKKELADALRAFADALDKSGGSAQPEPDPS
ncbi:hypothetical protein ACIGXF_31090 [Streptomyces sp. NPDC053086]|uniref:hypothetical protein n=1 Tax=unclassified Streptomyces TaxID=2593676 RepID=UPI0037D8BE73